MSVLQLTSPCHVNEKCWHASAISFMRPDLGATFAGQRFLVFIVLENLEITIPRTELSGILNWSPNRLFKFGYLGTREWLHYLCEFSACVDKSFVHGAVLRLCNERRKCSTGTEPCWKNSIDQHSAYQRDKHNVCWPCLQDQHMLCFSAGMLVIFSAGTGQLGNEIH